MTLCNKMSPFSVNFINFGVVSITRCVIIFEFLWVVIYKFIKEVLKQGDFSEINLSFILIASK